MCRAPDRRRSCPLDGSAHLASSDSATRLSARRHTVRRPRASSAEPREAARGAPPRDGRDEPAQWGGRGAGGARPRASPRAPPPRQVGRPLARNALPLDLGPAPRRDVARGAGMGGAARAARARRGTAAPRAAGGLGEATGAGRGPRRRRPSPAARARATHWRHPARLLPATVCASSSVGRRAGAHRRREARRRVRRHAARRVGGALRSLYYALRAGRCPYFYCRHDETYSLVWRNAALPLGANAAGVGGAAHAAGRSRPTAGGCYAVLAPSTGALRAQPRRRRRAVRDALPRRRRRRRRTRRRRRRRRRGARGGGGGFGGGGGAAAGGGDAAAPTDREGAAELAALNAHNERAPLPPRSADGVGGDAAAVGRRCSSPATTRFTLSYDWMLNQKVQAVLSTQLLAPQPFLHGAPRAARVHCCARHRRRRHVGGGQRDERAARDDARRGGGCASEGLLPGRSTSSATSARLSARRVRALRDARPRRLGVAQRAAARRRRPRRPRLAAAPAAARARLRARRRRRRRRRGGGANDAPGRRARRAPEGSSTCCRRSDCCLRIFSYESLYERA